MADSVLITPQQQQQPQPAEQNYQVSYQVNPTFERSPENDSFQSGNKSGSNKAGVGLGIFATAALVTAGIFTHKGAKVLEGKNATIIEKLKTGYKESLNKGKGILKRLENTWKESTSKGETFWEKIKKCWDAIFKKETGSAEKKTEEIVKSAVKDAPAPVKGSPAPVRHDMTGRPKVYNNPPKQHTKKVSKDPISQEQMDEIRSTMKHETPTRRERSELHESRQGNRLFERNPKPKEEYHRMSKSEIERQIEDETRETITSEHVEEFRNSLGKRPNRSQQLTINNINTKAKKATSEGNQIGNRISKEQANELRQAVETPAPKPAASRTAKPAPQTVPSQVDPNLANQIKGVEGNIKRLEQRIEGAKKFGKDTTSLQKELEANQRKLADLQAKAQGKVSIQEARQEAEEIISRTTPTGSPTPTPVVTNPAKRTENVVHSFSQSEAGQQNMARVRELANAEARKRGIEVPGVSASRARAQETVDDFVGKRFSEIPGFAEGSNVIEHRDSNGTLLRTIIRNSDGSIEIREATGNGIAYVIRDGIKIRKSDIGKQTDNMYRLVHSLDGAKDAGTRRSIIDTFAKENNLVKVNETTMIDGESVKIIYKGFDYDITADGRVLTKSYISDGLAAFRRDVTDRLRTPEDAQRLAEMIA